MANKGGGHADEPPNAEASFAAEFVEVARPGQLAAAVAKGLLRAGKREAQPEA